MRGGSGLIDTSDPESEPLALRDFGQAYDVSAALAAPVRAAAARTPQRDTAAERSFQRVVQAMDEASTKSVRFGFD